MPLRPFLDENGRRPQRQKMVREADLVPRWLPGRRGLLPCAPRRIAALPLRSSASRTCCEFAALGLVDLREMQIELFQRADDGRADHDAREPFVVGRHHVPRRQRAWMCGGSRPGTPPCISAIARARAMSAIENFQFFAGSSSRSRKRWRCSSFDTLRKNFSTTVPLRERYARVRNILEPFAPDVLRDQLRWKLLLGKNFRVHPHHQSFLVVGAVEDADAAALAAARPCCAT